MYHDILSYIDLPIELRFIILYLLLCLRFWVNGSRRQKNQLYNMFWIIDCNDHKDTDKWSRSLSSTWPPLPSDVLCDDSRQPATGNRKDVLWGNVLRSIRQKCKREEETGRREGGGERGMVKDERKSSQRRLGMKDIRFLDSSWVSFNSCGDHLLLRCFCSRGPSSRDTRSNQDISGFTDKVAHFCAYFWYFSFSQGSFWHCSLRAEESWVIYSFATFDVICRSVQSEKYRK